MTKKIGFRDIVQVLYYREVEQSQKNLNLINKIMDEGESFMSWEEFMKQPEKFIVEILTELKDELDCEHKGQDDIGYRQGGYDTEVVSWNAEDEQSMYISSSLS